MLPVIYSDEFLLHETGYFHPEKPDRLTAIKKVLLAAPWANQLDWQIPTPIALRPIMADIERVHTSHYISTVQQLADQGGGYLDADTPVSSQSYEVALLAVSAWRDGIDQVIKTKNPAFVLARPPGHHALSDRGMGFCLFSNAAIAAFYALQQPGTDRVAILDWDVHHGNGTQAIVETHSNIAYCSLHESPQYPGTGAADDRGVSNNVLNIPLQSGSAIAQYQSAFEQQIIPFFTHFQPDLLIISAGYDANQADPLAGICLRPEDYSIFTQHCLQITRNILFGLEGGYDLDALAQSVAATLQPCLGN
ncbi:histone deacetylase [Phormidium sp. CLA17]|uniref:histone deacetylase family protein n=1 Tax=Leptolyngbya sp. Cla-17 TaxID=2803751 RepID=UPI001492D5C7|nr:histone deacetylase [Leptolyngbya sp. Cla-17]MBM0740297.1 histone deacetylase [Leptolyngbya sp. Cla-17]